MQGVRGAKEVQKGVRRWHRGSQRPIFFGINKLMMNLTMFLYKSLDMSTLNPVRIFRS